MLYYIIYILYIKQLFNLRLSQKASWVLCQDAWSEAVRCETVALEKEHFAKAGMGVRLEILDGYPFAN